MITAMRGAIMKKTDYGRWKTSLNYLNGTGRSANKTPRRFVARRCCGHFTLTSTFQALRYFKELKPKARTEKNVRSVHLYDERGKLTLRWLSVKWCLNETG